MAVLFMFMCRNQDETTMAQIFIYQWHFVIKYYWFVILLLWLVCLLVSKPSQCFRGLVFVILTHYFVALFINVALFCEPVFRPVVNIRYDVYVGALVIGHSWVEALLVGSDSPCQAWEQSYIHLYQVVIPCTSFACYVNRRTPVLGDVPFNPLPHRFAG